MAKYLLGAAVPRMDDFLGSVGDDRVLGTFHNRGREPLRLLRRMALGHIPLDRDAADDLAMPGPAGTDGGPQIRVQPGRLAPGFEDARMLPRASSLEYPVSAVNAGFM